MVNTGQSVYFVNLVIMQCFGNLFSTRTLTLSIFQHNPFFGKTRNLYCLLSIPISLGIMFFVLYLPSCNTVLGTSPVPFEFYFISLAFAMSIIVYDEIRKLLKRNKWLGFQYTIWHLANYLIKNEAKSIQVILTIKFDRKIMNLIKKLLNKEREKKKFHFFKAKFNHYNISIFFFPNFI